MPLEVKVKKSFEIMVTHKQRQAMEDAILLVNDILFETPEQGEISDFLYGDYTKISTLRDDLCKLYEILTVR